MPVTSATSPSASDPFLAAYKDQISKLEADPNATQSYKDGLEAQFEAVKTQMLGKQTDASSPPADGSATPQQSVANAPGAVDSGRETDPTGAAEPTSSPQPAGSTSLGSKLPPALQALAPDIEQASKVTGESADLIAAQVWQESRGVSAASTTNGGTGLNDAGLMQVDAATFGQLQQEHPELQGKSLGDNLTNLEAGAFYEQDMKKQFGSDDLALRAYNSGPGSVDKSNADVTTTGLGDPTYVQKVDAFAKDIQNGTTLPA